MRTKGTEKTWPDETPEELIAHIRRTQGDEVADFVAAQLEKAGRSKKGRRPIYAGDKRSRKYGGIAVRGKASRWRL